MGPWSAGELLPMLPPEIASRRCAEATQACPQPTVAACERLNLRARLLPKQADRPPGRLIYRTTMMQGSPALDPNPWMTGLASGDHLVNEIPCA